MRKESDYVTRDSAFSSRSEVRQHRGTTWFRIPLNSFSLLGQLKGNDLTVRHLLVIEGKWEALREFPFKKYTVHTAIVKVNIANRRGPGLTNKHRGTSNIWRAGA